MRTVIAAAVGGGLQPAARSGGLKASGYVLIVMLLVFAGALPARAQERTQEIEPPDGTKINSAQVSGFEITRLSPGLQEDIGKLAGTPLNRQLLKELAARIEAEQPRYVAAIRATQEADGGARVVFVVARIRDQGRTNINEKYTVEAVEVRGVKDSDISQPVRDALNGMVGKPFDTDEAERLGNRLRDELLQYDIVRTTTRGTEQGRIKLIYHASRKESARWLRYEQMDSNAVFHSDQGWGANLPLIVGSPNFHVVPYFPWDTVEGSVEERTGFGVTVESRKVGTDRLGVYFDWHTYDTTWQDPTLAAVALNPQLPALYRNRMSFTPLVKFAITPQVSVAGGVSVNELDPEVPDPDVFAGDSQMANAVIGSIRFHQGWTEEDRTRHNVSAAFTVRAGTESLQSDLVYEHYLGEAQYIFHHRKHRVIASFMAGGLTGDAPYFERFTLGDTRTLRGWNKYDIAPAGGDRMFYTSVQYRFHGVAMFLDSGSVWDDGTEKRVRFSTGVGFNPGPVFFTLAFPINTDEFRAVFAMGFRWNVAISGVKWD
jgi:hypothetical protein